MSSYLERLTAARMQQTALASLWTRADGAVLEPMFERVGREITWGLTLNK